MDSPDLTGVQWVRGSPPSQTGSYVEVANLPDGGVAFRHSGRPDGQIMVYTAAEWRAFLEGVKQGDFDGLVA